MNENEKKEVMDAEYVETEPTEEIQVVYQEEQSGLSTVVAMAIGGAIATGAIIVGKKLKDLYDKAKAKKARAEEPVLEVVSADAVNDPSQNVNEKKKKVRSRRGENIRNRVFSLFSRKE